MLQTFTLGSFAQGVSAGGGAFESIASVTPSGSVNSVTFSSIPANFASLQLRINARSAQGTGTDPIYLLVRVNADTTTAKPYHAVYGDGANVLTNADTGATNMFLGVYSDGGYAANICGVAIIDIHDYASTTRNKTFRSISGVDRNATTGGEIRLSSGLWISTAAITSITITNNGGYNYSSSSTFALYGIKGA